MSEVSEAVKSSLMDIKSKSVYEKWKSRYENFKQRNGVIEDGIGPFLDYLRELSTEAAASTVWQAASCINKYFKLAGTSLITHPVFKAFMKNLEKSYVPKKSSTLDLACIHRFLNEYDNSDNSLAIKLAMIFGVYGALRVSEICNIHFHDILKDGDNYLVTISKSKTDQAGIGDQFALVPMTLKSICPCSHIERYMSLFENPTGRFLRKFGKNGKPTSQPIGVNTIASWPAKVANYLGLHGDYTGHCFRRSSATILADSGVNMLQLKRHGRWKSNSCAEGYVDKSKAAKLEVANILNGQKSVAAVAHGTTVDSTGNLGNCAFHNCQVSIVFH